MVDPPWAYDNKRTGGSLTSGAVDKYPTLSVSDICQLPIDKIAEENSCLFLWVTVPFFREGFQVLDAWGYTFKTMITWHKTGRLGMGFWFRGQTEHLLFATKGKIPTFRSSRRNLIEHPTLGHSKKPAVFRELIEDVTKTLPERKMVEIFARETPPGWDAIGNEIDGLDIREVLSKIE